MLINQFKCCGTTSICDGFTSDDEVYNGCECSSLDDSICSDVLPDNSTCTKAPANKIYTTVSYLNLNIEKSAKLECKTTYFSVTQK